MMPEFNPLFPEKQWQNMRHEEPDGSVVYRCFGKRHRSGGPAITRPENVARKALAPLEEYYFKGSLHRKGGPARIWPKGLPIPDTRLFLELPENTYLSDVTILLGYLKEEWYLGGLRHRDDGPAIRAHGEEQYWTNGKLHRTDGPAIIRDEEIAYLLPRHFSLPGPSLAREEYWEEGILLYRHLNNGTREWYNKEGQLHRCLGPAVMRTKSWSMSAAAESFAENALWEYRRDGELHRTDGPAMASFDHERNRLSYIYYQDGLLGRRDGPAEIHSDGEKIWKEDGQVHRKGGPAIERGSYQEWRWRGQLHRTDGPAIIDETKEIYFQNGQRHRSGGPAYITEHFEEWHQNNFLHRIDGPAVSRDPRWSAAHNLPHQEYWIAGQLHRTDGPAQIYSDGSVFYYQDNHLHRDDGPAVSRSRQAALEHSEPLLEYYRHGKLHRTDGPARIWPGGKEEHWRDGLCFSPQIAAMDYPVVG